MIDVGVNIQDPPKTKAFVTKTNPLSFELYGTPWGGECQNDKHERNRLIRATQYDRTVDKDSPLRGEDEISILYLSSESPERILKRIEEGKVSPSVEHNWRKERHSWFCTIKKHPIDEWESSRHRLLRTYVIPFIQRTYKALLRAGVRLALDFTKEDRAIQTVCDRFNMDDNMRPYVMKYNKFFDVWQGEIESRIRTIVPRILHIAGHGTCDYILFPNKINKNVKISAENLAKVLNKCAQQPELVFFAACDSLDIAKSVLRNTKIKGAVGIKGKIDNEKVASFSRSFYGGIAQGKRISDAIKYARSETALEQVESICKTGGDIAFVHSNVVQDTKLPGQDNMQECIKERNLFKPDSPLSPIKRRHCPCLKSEIKIPNVGCPSKSSNYTA